MHDFILALLGGAMLGVAAVGYLYVHGRIAGMSGLIAQVLNPDTRFKTPALWFLAGLIFTPCIYALFVVPEIDIEASPMMMVVAGLLVGFGTRLGSGCTSGHGICGISRLSKRSIMATVIFMFTGFVTVYGVRQLIGVL